MRTQVEAAAAGFIYRKSARVEKKDEPSPVEEEEAGSQNQPEHVSPDPPQTVVVVSPFHIGSDVV